MVYIYTLMLCLVILSYEVETDGWVELLKSEEPEQKSDSHGLTEKPFIRRYVMKRPHTQKRFAVPPQHLREVRADHEMPESLGQPVSLWHHRPFWRLGRQAASPEPPGPNEPSGPVSPPEPPVPPVPPEPSGPDQSPEPPESPGPFEPSESPGPVESSRPPGPDEVSTPTLSTEIEEITTTSSPLLTTTTTTTTVETTTMETKETTTTSSTEADTTTTEEEEKKPRKSTTLAPVAGDETEFDIFPTPFHLAVMGGGGALLLFLLIFCCCCCRGGSGPTSTVRATKSQMGSRKRKKGKSKKVKKSTRSVRKPQQPSQPSSSASASASGSSSQPRKAKKMEAEKINMMEFADKGVLVMQDVKGEVKHALDNEKSGEIVRVQYDTGQNELVTIGSEVEIIKTFSKVGSSSGDVKTSQSKMGAAKQKGKTGPH